MLMSLILATILAAVMHVPMMGLGISLGGAALFSLYLIHDIQMIIGESDVTLIITLFDAGGISLPQDSGDALSALHLCPLMQTELMIRMHNGAC